MQHQTDLRVATPVNDLPRYPEELIGQRLDSHYYFAWHFNRWLNSRTRLLSDRDIRGDILELYFISQNQSPVGTLPTDDRLLAKLLGVSLEAWQGLCARSPISVLEGWKRCLCGDEVRLMHPTVTEVALAAVASRTRNAANLERRRQVKRLTDLRSKMEHLPNGAHMARNEQVLEMIDQWLIENCEGNRTAHRVLEAMEAVSVTL